MWLLGGGGGAQPVGVTFHPLQVKMEISATIFFDVLTVQNDQISYVKHVLAPLYVFFTLFGLGGGGGSEGV